MDDLISRQSAIDSIEKHLRFGDELYPLTDTDKVLNHAFAIAASCVYNLPSAQPEIIRCKDCKYYRNGHGWNCIEYTICDISPLHTVIRKPDDYCSRAERRTDG